MSDYNAPLADMMFALNDVVGCSDLPQMQDIGADDIAMILENAGALARDVLSPLNSVGDKNPSRVKDGVVTTPPGFRDAYKSYCDGGWNSVPFGEEFGGQGLPWVLAFPIQEMWQSANMGFGLCPMLNQAAVEAVDTLGTPAQKNTYLAKLISGEWTGTMNLTEPQAGSDLAAVKTKAVKQDDGTYRLFGQKIYITYGEHDFTDNIIHLVLARLPDAPEGVKGISMFIVPKFIPDANGHPGARNDLSCVSLEHKLGIHGSPTCTMQFGDGDGAVGYLIGNENEGLKHMFIMMNNARLAVGLQGVALAERAYQKALSFAKDRKQGTSLTDKSGAKVAIIDHADIRRMLLTMKAQIEAGRLLSYEAARCLDLAHGGDAAAQARVDLLTPIVKAWCTDMANDVASTGIQIHGGMGFIEETGAAQYFRDARILPIYEGTNGIQSLDLVMRKIIMNKGVAMAVWLEDGNNVCSTLRAAQMVDIHDVLQSSLSSLRTATDWLLANASNINDVAAVTVPYMRAFGYVAGAVMMARAAVVAQARITAGDSDPFLAQKIATARFYMTHILPFANASCVTVTSGSAAVNSEAF